MWRLYACAGKNQCNIYMVYIHVDISRRASRSTILHWQEYINKIVASVCMRGNIQGNIYMVYIHVETCQYYIGKNMYIIFGVCVYACPLLRQSHVAYTWYTYPDVPVLHWQEHVNNIWRLCVRVPSAETIPCSIHMVYIFRRADISTSTILHWHKYIKIRFGVCIFTHACALWCNTM